MGSESYKGQIRYGVKDEQPMIYLTEDEAIPLSSFVDVDMSSRLEYRNMMKKSVTEYENALKLINDKYEKLEKREKVEELFQSSDRSFFDDEKDTWYYENVFKKRERIRRRANLIVDILQEDLKLQMEDAEQVFIKKLIADIMERGIIEKTPTEK